MFFFGITLIVAFFFAILYQRFRANMGRFIKSANEDIERYNYSALTKLLLVFIFIETLPLLFLWIFIEIYGLSLVETKLQLFMLLTGSTVLGFANATYLTTITIEQFVMKPIKELEYYKPLRIAIKYFHGPVSHVGQYMGINLLLVTLTQYEKFSFEILEFRNLAVPVCIGLLLGVAIGYVQHVNRNWVYQFWAFLSILIIYVALLITKQIGIKNEFSILVLIYLIVSFVFVTLKNLSAHRKGERNIYAQEHWEV